MSATVNQKSSGTEFVIEYKHTETPTDGLLFFIPLYNSKGDSNLIIKTPKLVNGSLQYDFKTYHIEVETNNGLTRNITVGDIIAYRMCIFRFGPNNKIILINSPLYNEAKYNSIEVTNAKFINAPQVQSTEEGKEDVYYTLVDSKQFDALVRRVESLEQKFIYGNIDAEEALADKEAGTIYIKVEE